MTTRVTSLAAIAGLVAGGTACEPPPPRPVISVNTVAAGTDANPGDGACEATAGAGNCTLQAALREANALGTADIVVPDGVYPRFNANVTGNVRINWDSPRDVHVAGRWSVAVGGVLAVEGLSRTSTGNTTYIPAPYPTPIAAVVPDEFEISVQGALVARALSLFGDSWGTLYVAETGTAVVVNSQVQSFLSSNSPQFPEGLTATIYNAGFLAMDDVVAFHPYNSNFDGDTCRDGDFLCMGPTTVLYAEQGSQTKVRNSVIARVPVLNPFSCGPSGQIPWVAPGDCEMTNFASSCIGPVNFLEGNRVADIVVPGGCDTVVEIPEGSPGPEAPPALSTWVSSIPAGCASFLATGPVAGCFPEWWTFTT